MDASRPLIGITPGYDESNRMIFVKDGYYQGIIKAGGMAAVLPLTTEQHILDEFIKRCDGFLICGGPDLDAKFYGESNMPYNGQISPYRDEMEIYIVKNAIERRKPLLGICRGIQVINAAMGGTLYQDIGAQLKGIQIVKHSQDAPKWYPFHEIHIEKGSKVWESFSADRIRVNSFHHQAVKEVAPGFKPTSWTSDGIIESIEYDGHLFAVGVQWHPELMWEKDAIYLKLFEDFVRRAAG